jgi:hypothetical protein
LISIICSQTITVKNLKTIFTAEPQSAQREFFISFASERKANEKTISLCALCDSAVNNYY